MLLKPSPDLTTLFCLLQMFEKARRTSGLGEISHPAPPMRREPPRPPPPAEPGYDRYDNQYEENRNFDSRPRDPYDDYQQKYQENYHDGGYEPNFERPQTSYDYSHGDFDQPVNFQGISAALDNLAAAENRDPYYY